MWARCHCRRAVPSCPLTSASGEPLADHEGCGLSQGDALQAGVRETLCFAMTRTAQTNLFIVGRSPAMHHCLLLNHFQPLCRICHQHVDAVTMVRFLHTYARGCAASIVHCPCDERQNSLVCSPFGAVHGQIKALPAAPMIHIHLSSHQCLFDPRCG